MLKVLDNEVAQEEQAEGPTLDELAREGARRMLMKALAVEVAQYVEEHGEERDAQGRRLVVRNGRAQARKVTCGAGTLEVQAPRINDKRVEADGQRQRFTSRILPPYMRRSPKVAEVLPILYLRGLSTGDFREALPVLLGEDAAGLSATNIARLTAVWDEEYRQFRQRDLADRDYVYVWVDGIHFNIRLEDDRLCTLVMIGARPDGTKELIALEDGYRESTESWADVLRDLRRRGGCGRRWWRLGTAPWASGARCVRCGPRRGSSATGATSWRTCSTSCRNGCSRRRSARSARSCMPRPASRLRSAWMSSSRTTVPSIPRRPRAWTPTVTGCSRTSTFRRNTGRTCARPT